MPANPKTFEMPNTESSGEMLRWRGAEPSDAAALWRLLGESAAVDSPKDITSLEEVQLGLRSAEFAGSRFTLASDTALGFSADGTLIAYAAAKLGAPGEREVEVSLEGTVHPEWRRRGIGRAILSWQEARGRALLLDKQSKLPGMLHLAAREDCVDQLALYRAAGFSAERWWMDLRRPLNTIPEARELQEGVAISEFKAHHSERARIAINDAFRDHWSTQAISPEQWESEGNLAAFSAKCSRVALVREGRWPKRKRIVAALLSEIRPEDWKAYGESFGYISAIGVVRDWRGKGLSSALIIEALQAFSRRRLDAAWLSVDSVNPSGALAMYERLGFELVDRSVSYVKYC